MAEHIVEMRDIHKCFGHIQALRGAGFRARRGAVTAIVGDNGSGKTTLMKILCGIIKPDQGQILIDGQAFAALNPAQAAACGIAAMHQDLALDNMLDSAGNIFLGRELTKYGCWLDIVRMRREAAALLRGLEIDIADISTPVAALSGGQRQALAFARAFHCQQPLLVLDEPTAAMGLRESARILGHIERLRRQGASIIMISHNLFQVFEIADYICIMRNGYCLGETAVCESSPVQINEIMLQQREEVDYAG